MHTLSAPNYVWVLLLLLYILAIDSRHYLKKGCNKKRKEVIKKEVKKLVSNEGEAEPVPPKGRYSSQLPKLSSTFEK